MEKQSLYIKKQLVVIVSLLLVAILGIIGCSIYIHIFNIQERTYTSSDPGKYLTMSITPRGGASDQWMKTIPGKTLSYGTIYRGYLSNNSALRVSDWKLRINIHETCYINNAWCGVLEIHQKTEDGEKVQTLDLRDFSVDDVTLDYIQDGPDTLIILTDGDYIIYHPSVADHEYPIEGTPEDTTEDSAREIGLIIYTYHQKATVFDDIVITYHMHQNMAQLAIFWGFAGLGFLCLLAAIMMIVVSLSVKSAEKRIRQDELIIEQSISVLTKFVDAKDSYTNGHSYRVAEYSMLLGQKLGFSQDECRLLYYIALMHDCGKVVIPDAILKKPDKLTDEEYLSIKTHTTAGAELLKDFTSIKGIREGALYHHERFDGTGYPTGKKGEDIPLVGRIICVADAFDAMNSQRCYRSRRSLDYIITELKENRGKQFDPQIVDCFFSLIQEGKIAI